VQRLDVLIFMADRQTLRVGQGFLEFCSEFVDSHQATSNFDYHQNEAFSASFKRFFARERKYLTIEAQNRFETINGSATWRSYPPPASATIIG
jgi:hypothetical protein